MTRLRPYSIALTFLSLLILAGCSTPGKYARGGYYQNDGPGANPPANVASLPDAVPRVETYLSSTSKPYEVFGKEYVPVKPDHPYKKRGTATWYGRQFNGQKTASGERYNMYAMTAAHPTLPIPSYAKVTRVSTGKSIVVRINDRGPFHSNRIIDLSYAAAAKLGLIRHGSDQVLVQAITNDDIRKGDQDLASSAPQSAPPTVRSATGSTTPDVLAALGEPRGSISVAHPATSADIKRVDRARTGSASSSGAEQLAYADGPSDTWDSGNASWSANTARDTTSVPGNASRSNGGVYLQFGAFSGEQNAQHLASKLNRQMAKMDSPPATVDPGAHLYRVQVGPYPNRTAAAHAARRIHEATGSASTVTER